MKSTFPPNVVRTFNVLSRWYVALWILLFIGLFSPPVRATHYGPISVQEIPLVENRSDRTAHGYIEYRFRVTNQDKKPHRVVLSMPRQRPGFSATSLTRSTGAVEVPPESNVVVRLLQPPIMMEGAGEVVVSIDGSIQRDTTSFFKFDQHLYHYSSHSNEIAHALVSQSVPPDLRDLLRTGPPKTPPAGTTPPVHHTGAGDPEVIPWLASVPVEEWSDSWLAYTRFDCVILTDDECKTLESRKPAVLSALQKYVEAGGMLGIVGTDWKASKDWTVSADRQFRAVFGLVCLLDKDLDKAKPQVESFRDLVLQQSRPWSVALHDAGFGRRFVPAGVTNMMTGNTPLFTTMPVLANYNVNVKLIMVLIVVFAVLIGPVNIYVLSLIKRRIWLLWTVPATSLIAAILVLGVSVFQEGILRQASSATYTVLDQRREEATTIGFVGFYSTLMPQGPVFSPDTEVTPCINRGYGENRSLELNLVAGGNQFFSHGWISARVPAYFAVRKAESQQKKRIVFDWTATPPTATNGLGVDIKRLTVCSPQGTRYQLDEMPAGKQVALENGGESVKMSRSDFLTHLQALAAQTVQSGPGTSSANHVDVLPAGSYFAEIDAWNPFLESGIERMKPYKNTTAVFGLFE